jgi:hypothetical protein
LDLGRFIRVMSWMIIGAIVLAVWSYEQAQRHEQNVTAHVTTAPATTPATAPAPATPLTPEQEAAAAWRLGVSPWNGEAIDANPNKPEKPRFSVSPQ